MDNRVYYGEYSLRHWINLILKNNIVLPEYQRYFVWNEKKLETLIETIKNKQFVPPITIGAFKINGISENLILDGQQRITSILLAYLGLFPDKEKYKKSIETFLNDNDDLEDELPFDNILEWNMNQLTDKGKNKESILEKITTSDHYKTINLNINDSFFDTNFLGFSYLVPQSPDEKEQKRYYSSVFRNINIQGEPLLPQESRASLYFLDKDLKELFSPDFCKNIVIKIVNNKFTVDFVRYLSLLSQYNKNGDVSKVARGFKPKMEKFYEEYIYSTISSETSEIYTDFLSIFPNKEYKDDLNRLEKALTELNLFTNYKSIIEIDTYLFGLIYQIIFKKSNIDFLKKDELKNELSKKIMEFKNDSNHQKNPNNLRYLRNRISESIEIYGRYCES
ncbi:DUF262 domain-containing protein [Aliarcobacter butzleri]|uniref:DUF262 domain-containing protein n=1 Tax=Aliarcobacter butzleri TaxID=28197 RepID=UPI003AEDB9BF